MKFVNQYISIVKKNVYKITFSEEDIKIIEKYIIHEKTSHSRPLTINDLYLIRITTKKIFPGI